MAALVEITPELWSPNPHSAVLDQNCLCAAGPARRRNAHCASSVLRTWCEKRRLGWARYIRLSPLATCCASLARIHFTYMRTAAPGAARGYPYGGTAYANPDAVTQIANGVSTTTFAYDNNGNVTQK